jgi:hypothetical protein
MSQDPVAVTGVWLRRIGAHAEVLAEVDGQWRLLAREYLDSNFSHIVEPSLIRRAQIDLPTANPTTPERPPLPPRLVPSPWQG